MAGDENQPPRTARGDGTEENHLTRLPDDVLADVIGRVRPQWVAVSRCVCRAWRDTIDSQGLLRADLLPLSLAGLFIHFNEHKYPEFFARPSSGDGARAVSGNLSFLPSTAPHAGTIWDNCDDWCDYGILDHCNGLVLLSNDLVVNPATRQWKALPPCPAEDCTGNMWYSEHLIYDPMISPHYEVFMIPCLEDNRPEDEVDPSMEESEWPPSPYKMYVFSSRSGCWDEKYFVREGDAARTFVSEMRVGWLDFTKNAVYFRRALYIHCGAAFLMRISLSDSAYHVIKPPIDIKVVEKFPDINIVRSAKGVYFVVFENYKCWLRVWILNESCGQMEWMLKHDKNLTSMLARHRFDQGVHGHWILEDINYKLFRSSHSPNDMKEATNEQIYEWNSDDDDDDDCHQNKESCNEKYDIQILGFHPHKEIVFLSDSKETGLAYHLNGSKIEVLGNIYAKDYTRFKEYWNAQEWITSYPYTPCWIEEFPQNN